MIQKILLTSRPSFVSFFMCVLRRLVSERCENSSTYTSRIGKKIFFMKKFFFYEGIKGYSPSIRIHLQDSAIFLAKVDLPTPCQEVEYRGIEALEKKYLLVFGYALVELWWGLSA